MNIKELQGRITELKAQGNALWEKAEKETKDMPKDQKEVYMAEVRKTDEGIYASLKETQELLDHAMQYDQVEEKKEIERTVAQREKVQGARPANSRSDFNSFGQLLQAVAAASNGIIASTFPRPYQEELAQKLALYQASYHAAASGMSVGVPSDGGYLVRQDWTNEFLTRGRQASVLLPLCRRIPIGAEFDGLEYPYIDETSRVDGSRWGGVQVFWAAEATSVTAKQPKIGKGELRLEEIMGLAYATNRLLRDAAALEGVLSSSFESEFGFKIDDSILRGNGAGQMLGILNSPVLVSVTRAAADVDTVLDMYSRLPSRLKNGAVWLYHSNWMKKLPKMVIGDMPVWLPPGGVTNGVVQNINGSLLGKPMYELEQCSDVGTPGDLILGNFGEYVYIEKDNEGMRFDQSMHVAFLTDQMAFRWVYRINGQPVARVALTPAHGSSTLSPFITVAA